jgi:Leucine-rich repeat (LRR) protein/triacylglycerol esterase/lipase EstA (alpha/beta hydrolase family)
MRRKKMLRCRAVLVGFFILVISINLFGSIPASERAALIAFYNSTNGDKWNNNSGWKTPPLAGDGFAMPGTEDTWYGVAVRDENVHGLEMGQNNLTGSIPPEIGQLSKLGWIWFSYNHLSGNIPPQITDLLYLGNLDLRDNEFSSEIPSFIGNIKSLDSLNLGGNQFTGSIPKEICNIPNMVELTLAENQLTGTIPKEIGNFNKLEALWLNGNKFTGSIPPELGRLSNLKALNLWDNSLTGTIPPELGNLIKLEYLALGLNPITGAIPPEIGNLTNLKDLALKSANLSGSIPKELGDLHNLKTLEIECNKFTGSIPPELGNLTNLVLFRLDTNQFSGSIPSELGDLTNLTEFGLGSNQLSGIIPSELGNLTKLTYLTLDHNQLTGEIPNSLTNLTKLAKPNVDIGYNCLYTYDQTLIQWLNKVDPDWEENQHNCQGIEQRINVKSPNGGEKWKIGTIHNILWTYVGWVGDIRIKYSTDNGNSWKMISQSANNTGSYPWTVPNTPSDLCKIKIEEAADGNPTDMSDSVFSISEYVNEDIKVSGRLRVVDPNTQKEWPIDHISLPSQVELNGSVKNITIAVNSDGTFEATEMLSEGSYSCICSLQYNDYIPYDNSEYLGGDPAPPGNILKRLSVRKFTVNIDKDHSYINIDFPLPIFCVHSIRAGWKFWNSWASYLLSEGYIVFTPNHDSLYISKATESDQLANQFFTDLNSAYNNSGIGLFNQNYPNVFFICHGEGGVVARVLVYQYTMIKNKIKAIFTLGTPHSGTDLSGAEIYSLSKSSMIFQFNKIYDTFNGVPVYAVSGHGLGIINSPEMHNDGIVFWNHPETNRSPFAICTGTDPSGISYNTTESFTGYSEECLSNGHHFPLSHSNLVKDGSVDILINTIIPYMTGSQLTFNEAIYPSDIKKKKSSSETFLRKILDQSFPISSGSSKSFEIKVPTTDLLAIHAMGIKSEISVNLTDPAGKSITGANYTTFPNVKYSSDIITGIEYRISTPIQGKWTIVVKAGSKNDVVAIGCSISSMWDIHGYTDKSTYQPKEQAILKAKISGASSGTTISKIQASIFNINWVELSKIDLYDDGKHSDENKGDGIYANTVNVSNTEGVYFVKFYSEALVGGQSTQRESKWNFSVAKYLSIIKGDFSDDSVDIDSDGMKDQINETVSLNFPSSGLYVLYGRMVDSTGSLISESAISVNAESPGNYQGILTFNAKGLECSQFSNPFQVRNITVLRADDLAPLDQWGETVYTKTYNSSDFGCNSGAILMVNRSKLNFGVLAGRSSTPQSFTIQNSGKGILNWEISTDSNWLRFNTIKGTNTGTVTVTVDSTNLSTGTYNGTITVSDSLAENSPQTIDVNLTVYNEGFTEDPFGEFATPTSGSTVSGSIAVTGWALDDIGIESVKLYRGEVGKLTYIGDAIFVEGARPDVEQAYPGYPMNYKAGWGYMMLTNFLPGGGNGEFKIHAIVTDAEGNQITLGTKTIRCDNAHAVKPFGAIDTPTQGGTASGKDFVNWGWVLTPLPNKIPEDGSTINIWVDGENIGHPTYNIYREDIATLFPGYTNSNGAIGYFYLDTTGYENGIHTIQWTATDSAGNADGIGSRYFSILNNGESSSNSQSIGKYRYQNGYNSILNSPIEEISLSNIEPLRIGKGTDEEAYCIEPDENGIYFIEIGELERLEVAISDSNPVVAGFSLVGTQLKPLPVGTTLCEETGKFYWTPGPGFVGNYHFVFIERNHDNYLSRKEVIVDIRPKSTIIHH